MQVFDPYNFSSLPLDTLYSNGFLEPAELAQFVRGLVRGILPREQHYLLMHLAGMDVTSAGTVGLRLPGPMFCFCIYCSGQAGYPAAWCAYSIQRNTRAMWSWNVD